MTKANDFHCKAIATKNSILDATGVPGPPLITICGKVVFNSTQAIVISFNLIAICARSCLYGNYSIICYTIIHVTNNMLHPCKRLRTNSVRQNLMAFSVSYSHKERLLRCCRRPVSVSDSSTIYANSSLRL